MSEEGTPAIDNEDDGGTPQTGAAAGAEPTSGNDEISESQVEEPTDIPADDDQADIPDGGDDGPGTPALARARDQAARYRRELRDTEADRDELAAALWTARVEALGILADPEDLELDPEALHDPDRIRALADELVERKPHLRTRRIRARAGQGEGTGKGDVSLAALLNRNA